MLMFLLLDVLDDDLDSEHGLVVLLDVVDWLGVAQPHAVRLFSLVIRRRCNDARGLQS